MCGQQLYNALFSLKVQPRPGVEKGPDSEAEPDASCSGIAGEQQFQPAFRAAFARAQSVLASPEIRAEYNGAPGTV